MAKRNKNKRVRADTKSIPTTDAFSNPAARTGFGTMDLMQATEYPLTRMTQNYQLLTSLYRDNWIVQNIISTIPSDMIRKWYEVKANIAPEYMKRMVRLEQKTQIRQKILQGMYWGRLYGGAAGVVLIRGHDDMSEPLNYDVIMPDSFLGIQILDRWSGVYPESELVTNPENMDFGLPKYYTIRDEETGMTVTKVHHSRIVRFVGRELPWMEKVAEQYWGESELEAIYNEVVKRDNVSANIAGLTFRANLNYMESDGLDQLLGAANTDVQRRFWQKMQATSILESNFGMRIVNKGDAMHNIQYTFTGLPEVYDRMMMDVAGAARTPVTKLFGRSPAGLNATGEADMRNYYDYIDGLRETDLRTIIERILPIMALSAWGEIPNDLDISFPPMQTPDSKEIAEITDHKSSAIIGAFQSDLIDSATAQKELQSMSDETGMFASITDESIKAGENVFYSDKKAMQDPMSGLMPPGLYEEEEDIGG